MRTVFDGFRNFDNEASEWGGLGHNVCSPCTFCIHARAASGSYDGGGGSGGGGSLPVDRGKKRTLEELFKPPIDITFKGDWRSAREAAESANKWLLVNIQDAGEFQCQVLNRDVWSGEAVKTIVREHFIFWQVRSLAVVFRYKSAERGGLSFHRNTRRARTLSAT